MDEQQEKLVEEPQVKEATTKASYQDCNGEYRYIPYGVVSFDDLDAMHKANHLTDLSGQMSAIVQNILDNPDVTDKATAIKQVADDFQARVDALDNMESKETDELSEGESKATEIKSGIIFTKQADGRVRWLATYSNKFRDDDNPPEIIAEVSHQRFVQMVDKGLAAYPELWYWHVPGTRWGVADYVAYDDQGFAIASGLVDEGKEHIADAVAKEADTLVSHGMPKHSITRDVFDPSVLIEHMTTEISPLPGWAAANKLTGFEILGSEAKEMALPEHKRETLAALGFDVEGLDKAINTKAQAADGLEFKEAETGRQPGQPETTEETPEAADESAEVETEADESAEEVTEPTEQQDVTAVTTEQLTEFAETVGEAMKQLATAVSEISAEVKELKDANQDREEKEVEVTPAASFLARFNSAIGSDATKIDGRTTLAKSGPTETESKNASDGPTLIPFVNDFLNAGNRPSQ